jgi:hypothetical protein
VTSAGALQANLPSLARKRLGESVSGTSPRRRSRGGQRLTVGVDIYNLLNNNVTLGFNPTFVPNVAGWQTPTSYMNPRVFRLNAEFAF